MLERPSSRAVSCGLLYALASWARTRGKNIQSAEEAGRPDPGLSPVLNAGSAEIGMDIEEISETDPRSVLNPFTQPS